MGEEAAPEPGVGGHGQRVGGVRVHVRLPRGGYRKTPPGAFPLGFGLALGSQTELSDVSQIKCEISFDPP